MIDSADAGNVTIANTILTVKVAPHRKRLAEISDALVAANLAASDVAREHIDSLQWRFLVSGILIMFLSVGISFLIYKFVSDRFGSFISNITSAEKEKSRLLDLLKIRQKKIEQLVVNLSTVEENQRKRFSHDLHDAIGHGLTTAKYYIDSARSELPLNPARAAELLDRTAGSIKNTLAEAKRISYELHPTLLDDVSLSAALKQFVVEFERRMQIKVHLDIAVPEAPLDPLIEINLYRIVQEAFTNIEKHANATEVSLQIIQRDDGTLAISITDNGKGFDAPEMIGRPGSPHLGLRNIVERGELIGGTVLIESRKGGGTEINIELPPNGARSKYD